MINSKPERYACQECGAKGVKLWRPYQTSAVELRCARCAEEEQRGSHAKGWESDYVRGGGDQIGWWVPAVPDPLPMRPDFLYREGTTYWGYTSVPPESVAWWKALPDGVRV